MRKIMVLIVFVLLLGCSQQEENCLDSFCVDSLEYGIEGTLSVEEIDRGRVELQVSLTDDEMQLRDVEVEIYSSEWDYITSEMNTNYLHLNNFELRFHALNPNTEYIAVLTGRIVTDGELKDINIAYTEFTTAEFTPVDVSGMIENIRVGNPFIVYDFHLLSNDYTIVSYGVFLYEGETKNR